MAVNSSCRLYFMIVCSLNMSYLKIKVKASEMLVSPCLGWPEAHSKSIILCFRRCPLKNMCISVEGAGQRSEREELWERKGINGRLDLCLNLPDPPSGIAKVKFSLITEEQLGPLDGLFSQVTWTTFKRISSEQSTQGLHGWPWKGVSFLSWKCFSWYWRM